MSIKRYRPLHDSRMVVGKYGDVGTIHPMVECETGKYVLIDDYEKLMEEKKFLEFQRDFYKSRDLANYNNDLMNEFLSDLNKYTIGSIDPNKPLGL